ncbi:hypothetical protein MKQ70_26330 [Chitinophaga sedimenti]|uniref:immunoglobulin domain-containing protein n=1 Tax=Chitinophaga sedimenti TaxID=2033606 RepID=UPI002004039D|nr:hypothetical protein [Chitinophaga sedimenti]MCK7558328.1 hypothetical protein [Chitinophaga sedimenti]
MANIVLGQTASFAASSTTPDLTFNWFNQPAGGTSIFTGSNFVTPALVANTTYYVEGISNTSGCNTITRSPATVIVGGGGANDVPCDVATAQTNGVNGVCLLCAVNNPQLAIDTDASTGTDLRVGVGLLGAYAQQTLIFPSAGNTGDSIIFSISVPSSLADVGLLSTVQVATYNGATFNNDLQSVNSNLLQLRLLGDNRTAIFTLPATAAYDRVEIRLNSGVAGALTSVYLNYAARKVAVPTFQADTVTICTGNTAILNVTAPPAGVTFNWYTSATGGTPFYTGNSYQTAVLTRDTTFYVESVRTVSGCVNPVRSAVRVAVAASVPAPTVAASAVTVCAGNPATLTATGPAGATFRWYAQQTGGTALFTGAVYTTAALDSSVLYYVEAVNAGGCASANRTAVQVNVTAEPPAPVINTTSPVACEGSAVTLSASSNVPGATIKWYANASGDTAIATGNSFTTPALTATTTYYAGVDAGQCSSSSRTAVTVTVSARPAAPTATIAPAGQVPYGQTATLTATSATPNVTFRWYSDSTSTSPLATGNSFTTPALSNTTRYFVEAVSNVSGCASNARTAVTVTVDRNFDPGCDVANAQDNAVGGICVACNVTNPDNAVDNDLNNYSNLHVTLGVAGAYSSQTLRFPFASGPGDSVRLKLELPGSVVNAGLLGAISIASYNGATYNNDRILLNDNLIKVDVLGGATGQVIVTFAPAASFDRVELRLNSGLALALSDLRVYYANRVITAPVVTPPSATICAGSTVTFTATASAEATINWYDAPTGGTLLTTGASYTTPQLNAITTYYVEAVRTANGCANPIRTQVMVNVRPVPQPPVITSANPSICAGQTATLRATTTDGSQVRWYDAPVNGTLLATDSTFITPALNSTTIYYAEAYNGTCSNSGARVAVTVTVGANVIPPVLDNANQSVCVGSNAVVNVVSPVAGYTYTWYTSLTGGTPVATGPTFTTPVLTASTIYYVEATTTGGTCAGGSTRVQAVINVSAAPALPVVVNPTPITCIGTSAQLSIQNPVAGVTYTWYNVATGGTPLAIGTTFNTPALTGTTTYYVSAVNSNNCASNGRASVTITANATPNTPALTDANVTVCRGSSTTLQVANAVAGVTYTWYDASVGGNVVFTGTSFATPAINANTSYYVEASQPGGCVSNARAVATVSITDGPSMPAVSAGPTICAGNSARLQVINPQAGILYSWFDAVTGGNQLAEDSVFFTTPALNATTTYYVQASAGTCASSSRVSITVTVSTTAGTVTLVNNSLTACRGTTVTFSVQNPQPGVTYRWYDALTGGNLVGTGADFTTPSLTGRSSYFVEGISATGCNSPSRTTAIANIIDPPTPPAVQAPEVTVCRGNTTVLAVDGEDVNYIYRWYDAPTGGNQVGSGGQFTTPAMNATTTYYVDAATTSGTCVSASRTAVKVNVVEQPAAPVLANAGIVSACAGATATFSVQNILPGATYRWYDAPTGGNLVYTGASFVTGVLSGPATYYVETVLSGTCVSSTRAQATANITVAPVAPVIAGHDAAICANNRDTLTATSLTPGVSFRWYSSLTETTPIFTGNVFITPLLTATTTYYVDAALPGGCVSAIRTPVIVEVAQPLAMPTVTVLDTEPTSITFQWNAVAGAIAYQVSTDGGITVQTPSSGLTGTSHTIQNLVPGQTVT